MAAADVVGQVREVAVRAASTYGLDVFDVQYRREAGGMVLRVQIDRPGPAASAEESVSVEDCARVSRDLSALLDVEEIVPTAYILEVSSPGLDRPLRTVDDFRRFSGRQAKIVVREPVNGQTFFRGVLAGVDDDHGAPGAVIAVMIDAEGGHRRLVPFGLIARANLEVEF